MFFNFKKNNLDSGRIYTIHPHNFSHEFMYLLNLLSNEDILLTFNEREILYKHIEFIIEFLEEKRNQNDNTTN